MGMRRKHTCLHSNALLVRARLFEKKSRPHFAATEQVFLVFYRFSYSNIHISFQVSNQQSIFKTKIQSKCNWRKYFLKKLESYTEKKADDIRWPFRHLDKSHVTSAEAGVYSPSAESILSVTRVSYSCRSCARESTRVNTSNPLERSPGVQTNGHQRNHPCCRGH